MGIEFTPPDDIGLKKYKAELVDNLNKTVYDMVIIEVSADEMCSLLKIQRKTIHNVNYVFPPNDQMKCINF